MPKYNFAYELILEFTPTQESCIQKVVQVIQANITKTN